MSPVEIESCPINWKASSRSAGTRTIEYSINDDSWVSIASSTADSIVNVVAGDVVRFRGNNTNYCSQSAGTYAHCFSASTAVFNAYGNIMSMIEGDDFVGADGFADPYVFRNFLYGTNLIDASNLIMAATALTEGCYLGTFGGGLLEIPPELPATQLATRCYLNMFINATHLTKAPALPATTLAYNCYQAMFYGCTNLETAPELPATQLTSQCYYSMFDGCRKLNYIKCLATNIDPSTSRTYWVRNVASTGTFVKDASMTSWPTGTNGIPSGWTVVDNV